MKRVVVECSTPSLWREFKRLLTMGAYPIGRIESDGAVAVLRPDRFRYLLDATEARVLGDAQCADCSDCRGSAPTKGER